MGGLVLRKCVRIKRVRGTIDRAQRILKPRMLVGETQGVFQEDIEQMDVPRIALDCV